MIVSKAVISGGPCHHGMARPQVADGRPPTWKVVANIMNKQSRTADKGWSSILGWLGGVLTTPHSKNVSCYIIFTQKASDLD
jgi:hypothetical protein